MNASAKKSTVSVLIVEDEGIVAMDLRLRLEEMGYQVIGTASTGENAVSLVLAHQPDVVLMDLHLQTDMTGMEAARIIEMKTEIPVVFVTAYTDNQTIEEIQRNPDFLLVMKPFNSAEIQTAIAKALTLNTGDQTI